MRSVVILGSTGSIGESALRVVKDSGPDLRVIGLAAKSNYVRLLEQAREFGVSHIALSDPEAAALAEKSAPAGIRVFPGAEGNLELAALPDADIVLCALVGLAGLDPTLTAIEAGHDVAIATKEVLVAAGELVMRERRLHGVRILPVDSEHSAVFQSLESRGIPLCARGPAGDEDAGKQEPGGKQDNETRRLPPEQQIRHIILTASGGPFVDRPGLNFDEVSVSDALNHPRWNMGPKVTVDSATLMNKGLEIMEAAWLFGVPLDAIEVVVHPESVVHSLVEFHEGSTLAQLSPPDMRLPIHYALHWPGGRPNRLPDLNLAEIGSLHFKRPDEARFPCLKLAREAALCGKTVPAVLNAANEVAVEAFLSEGIRFSDIEAVITAILARHVPVEADSRDTIMAVDSWARQNARQFCEGLSLKRSPSRTRRELGKQSR